MKKANGITISHGFTEHGINMADDCLECIDINLFWYKTLKEEGGKTKLVEKMKLLEQKGSL